MSTDIVLDGETFDSPAEGVRPSVIAVETSAASSGNANATGSDVPTKKSFQFSQTTGDESARTDDAPRGRRGILGVARYGDRKLTMYREIFYQNMGFGRRLLRPNLLFCNLLAAGILLGFFLWNFIVLASQFASEQNDPPVSYCLVNLREETNTKL
jgi:hypothetical protein